MAFFATPDEERLYNEAEDELREAERRFRAKLENWDEIIINEGEDNVS